MKKFTKNQSAISYYNKGKSCIDDAELLFLQNRKNYDILLFQGLELLLKSFILMNDGKITMKKLKDEYGHNCDEAYRHCMTLKNKGIISDPSLELTMKSLRTYETNPVNLRYQDKTEIRISPDWTSAFKVIKQELIEPIYPLALAYSKIAKTEEGPIEDWYKELGYGGEFDL